jgi:hypothetical protein
LHCKLDHRTDNIDCTSNSGNVQYSCHAVNQLLAQTFNESEPFHCTGIKKKCFRQNSVIVSVSFVKITILWGVILCSLVDIHWRFGGMCSLCHQGRKLFCTEAWRQYVLLKCQYMSVRLDGIMSQKTVIFIVAIREYLWSHLVLRFLVKIWCYMQYIHLKYLNKESNECHLFYEMNLMRLEVRDAESLPNVCWKILSFISMSWYQIVLTNKTTSLFRRNACSLMSCNAENNKSGTVR